MVKGEYSLYRQTLELTTEVGRPTFIDITEQVKEICARSGIREGLCNVVTAHTTCSVITEEYSHDRAENGLEYLQTDLCAVMERLIPTCRNAGQYLHPGPEHIRFGLDDTQPGAWSMLNTDAHLRSVLLGRDVALIVRDGAPDLGDFAYVYFVDWDQVRARPRRVTVQITGI